MFFRQVKGRLNQVFIGIGQRGNIAVEPSEEAQRCALDVWGVWRIMVMRAFFSF